MSYSCYNQIEIGDILMLYKDRMGYMCQEKYQYNINPYPVVAIFNSRVSTDRYPLVITQAIAGADDRNLVRANIDFISKIIKKTK